MEEKWLHFKDSAERAVALNKLEHAESLWYAALQEADDFPPHDPRVTITLECLAEVLFKQRKYAQAEPLCFRTLEIYEQTIGPDHPDVGVLANNLAMLYHMQNKFEQAETLYKKALAVQTKALGTRHPEVINLLGNYANLLFSTHRAAEAEHMRSMAKSATTGKWNMSGSYQAFTALSSAQPSSASRPQAPYKEPIQQQAQTLQMQKSASPIQQTPPPSQKPIMPELPSVPPPPSTSEPNQSGIGRLVRQRKDTLGT